jgi:RNA polymerase sigma factor (sigma-70 family)
MTLQAALDWAELVAAGVSAPPADRDDVQQEARIAAWQALKRYDEKRNDEFRGYAHRRVRGAALDALRVSRTEDLPAHLADGDSSPLASIERRPAVVQAALRMLTDRQRAVIQLTIVQGLTLAEAAALTGMSRSSCHNVRVAALRRLRELLSHFATCEGLL